MNHGFVRAWSFFFSMLTVASLTLAGLVSVAKAAPRGDTLNQWIQGQFRVSTLALLKNISPAGTAPGVVVASPSRQDPDYYFHWVRDAALVMDSVVTMYERAPNAADKARFFKLLSDYVELSRRNQLTPNPSGGAGEMGLGEPKFNVDGSAFTGPWGRPQNDGPALRVNTLARLARILIAEGKSDWVRAKLYDGKSPTQSVIKTDLEFLGKYWTVPSFDLWEEIQGQHFYTRMAQRKALLVGAQLAQQLNDPQAAHWYLIQARHLEQELAKHWLPQRNLIATTLDRVAGIDYKVSQLDVAIVLGVLHGNTGDGFFAASNDMVLASVQQLKRRFDESYLINSRKEDFEGQPMETAFGRYPEDRYSGTSTSSLGNPWFLATNGMAELMYQIAHELRAKGRVVINRTNAAFFADVAPMLTMRNGQTIVASDTRWTPLLKSLMTAGDSYLRRTRFHTSQNGSTAEQFNRDNGYMQGAHDLTWSYASFLTAVWVRSEVLSGRRR